MSWRLRKIDIVFFLFATNLSMAAAQTVWINGQGDWNDAANWSAGVPTAIIDAEVNNGGEAQLFFPSSGTTRDLTIGSGANDSGTVHVDGFFGAVSLTSRFITVGNSGTNTLLLVENNATLTSNSTVIANQIGSQGQVTLDAFFGAVVWNNTGSLTVGNSGSGTLQINGGLVTVNDTSATIADQVGSTGVVNVDTFFGPVTWNNSGSLTIGNSGHATLNGSGATITSTSGMIANQTESVATATIGGSWTMTGNLVVANSGTGTLNIDGGTVSNMNGDIAGQIGSVGTVNVINGGTWTINAFSDVGVDGAGTLNINTGGTVTSTMQMAIAEFGGTGTVNVDGAGSSLTITDSLSVSENGNGFLNVTNGGAVSSLGADIGESGTGAARIDGIGSTWTDSGNMIVGEFGSGRLSILNGATVSSTNSFLGLSSGSDGTAIVNGAGSIWTATALYVGGDAAGPGGTGLLRILNGGTVNAPTTVWSTGTLELGVNPILTGSLNFDGGTLRTIANTTFPNNAALATGGVIVDSNGFHSVLSGAWGGVGGLNKIGRGSITLTNVANSYSGDTNIFAGTLFVDGDIFSRTFVYPHGTLGGTGNIFGLVNNNGLVSPGHNSVGFLQAFGNYTQTAGATLRIQIGGTTSGVDSDFLAAAGGGQAFLAGTLDLRRARRFNPMPGDEVTIIGTTLGVNGAFDQVVDNFRTLIQPRVVYDPDQVRVVFFQGSFNTGGLTPNQLAVARALNRNVANPAIVDLVDFLDLQNIRFLPHNYDLIAPEELASIYEIGFSQAVGQNNNLMRRMEDIRAGSNGFSAAGFAPQTYGYTTLTKANDGKVVLPDKNMAPAFMPCPENNWGIFVTGSGDFVNVENEDENAPGYDLTTGDVTLGVDYRIGNHFAMGVAGGYAGSTARLVDDGRVEVDGEKIGGYLTAFGKGLFGSTIYVDLAGSGGWNNYDTRRSGLLGDATGSTDGAEWNGLLAYGSDWTFGGFTIGTWSTLQYTKIDIDGFSESGSLAPLDFPDQDQDSFRATSGLRANYEARFGKCGIVRPELRAAWQHEYQDRAYPIDANFIGGLGGFTVHGPQIGRDAALLGAGVNVQWCARFGTYLYYDGVLGRKNYDNNAVSGGFRVSF